MVRHGRGKTDPDARRPDPGPPLQAVLLGFGHAGRVFHAPLIAATSGLRLAAVVTTDPERRRAVETRYPDAELLPSPTEAWKRAGERGRGSVWHALLGALVIGSISNGMDLLGLDSDVKYMITGAVLLAAVTLDAVTRQQRQQAGRAA